MSEVNSGSNAVSFKAVPLVSAGQGLAAEMCRDIKVAATHSDAAILPSTAGTIREFGSLANADHRTFIRDLVMALALVCVPT